MCQYKNIAFLLYLFHEFSKLFHLSSSVYSLTFVQLSSIWKESLPKFSLNQTPFILLNSFFKMYFWHKKQIFLANLVIYVGLRICVVVRIISAGWGWNWNQLLLIHLGLLYSPFYFSSQLTSCLHSYSHPLHNQDYFLSSFSFVCCCCVLKCL